MCVCVCESVVFAPLSLFFLAGGAAGLPPCVGPLCVLLKHANVGICCWQQFQGPVGLMDKASASGAGDSRFESWAGQNWCGLLPVMSGPRLMAGSNLSTTKALSKCNPEARLAQSAERKALNLVVVGSSPTVGVLLLYSASERVWMGVVPV